MKQTKHIVSETTVNGVKYIQVRAQKAPKQITAKAKGSMAHCGRTNIWGVSV